MSDPKPTAHWRDSARDSKLWLFNSTTLFPLLLMLFHIKTWTFVSAFTAIGFFTVLSYYGFTVPVFFRWCRAKIAGRRRTARPWWM